ncbi:MAG: hypothetical protein GY906_27955 [bacterium]|nr:hypothetical protein [bacterium]
MRTMATMAMCPAEAGDFSPQRVVRLTAVLIGLGVLVELLVLRSVAGALSLTLAGVVAIINFRWLDMILERVIQPGEPQFDRASVLRIFARLSLLAVVLAAILLVPSVDPIAIALGFSAFVVALIVEGLRGARVGGG